MQLKQPSDEVDDVLKKIFYDEALGNYNYNGMCNVPNVRKRPMKDYAIFVSCFLGLFLRVSSEVLELQVTECLNCRGLG